jgi:hypothetical protein
MVRNWLVSRQVSRAYCAATARVPWGKHDQANLAQEFFWILVGSLYLYQRFSRLVDGAFRAVGVTRFSTRRAFPGLPGTPDAAKLISFADSKG